MLAEALNPVLDEQKMKDIVKSMFKNEVNKYYMEKMRQKVKIYLFFIKQIVVQIQEKS